MIKNTPLIELNRGDSSAKGAVFCFPGAGGGATTFVPLINILDNKLPVYGLQPRGLDPSEAPYSSIDEMIDIYFQVIQSKEWKGVYYFLGHSFGGYIALEVARKLNSHGYDVGPLVMLDTTAPQKPHIYPSRVDSFLSLIEVMEMACGKSFGLLRETLASTSDDDQLVALHKRMVAAGILPTGSRPDIIRGMVNVFIANDHMAYWPKEQYFGNTLLINAMNTKENHAQKLKNHHEWQQHLPNLVYKESPGNHVTLLDSPYVESLVEMVEQYWDLKANA